MGDINISELIAFRVQRLVPQTPDWLAREDNDAEKHYKDEDGGGCEAVEGISEPQCVHCEDSFVKEQHRELS